MRRQRLFLGMIILAVTIPLGAAPPPQLVILGAGANSQTGLLTIVGVNLGGSAATVQISGQTLAIQSSSDTEIVATMPALPAGTYLLRVARGPASVEQDTFSLSIGSSGAGGNVDSITAGPGLTGGGTSGDVTLAVDTSFLDDNYARLDAPNSFLERQDIHGRVLINDDGDPSRHTLQVETNDPDVFVLEAWSYATTGCNRAISANTHSECSAAVVGGAFAPTGGTGGAFESRGDGGRGVHATNTHPTGGGAGIVGEVLSPSAVAGEFVNYGDGTLLIGANSSGVVFRVAGDGTVTAFDFISSSSLRYKTNVSELGGALQAIERLRPVTFDWKASGKRDIGLIAEEVATVIPDAVAFDAEGPRGIDYQDLTALLIAAIKEQQDQIRELQRELRERE